MVGYEDADRCRWHFPQVFSSYVVYDEFYFPMFPGVSKPSVYGTGTNHMRHEYIMSSYGFYFIIINSIFTLSLHIFQHCNQSSGRKIVICTNTHNYRFILYKRYNYENIIISFSLLLQLQWRIKAFRLQKNTKTP